MKKIAIEEHFSTEEHIDCLCSVIEGKYPVPEVSQQEKVLARELPFLAPARRDA